MTLCSEQKYDLEKLTDPDYFLFPVQNNSEKDTGFAGEKTLDNIKGKFLLLKDDDFITPDIFEEILRERHVPYRYQLYLAGFVAELNKDHVAKMKLKMEKSERENEFTFENRINQEIKRFHYIPDQEDLKVFRKRETYLKSSGKAPAPEEITNIEKFYIIIQKQFRSKADKMEIISDDDIIYISTCWNLSPVQLIKVTQLASYANVKAKALEEEQKLVDAVKKRYTYENTECCC